MGEVAQAVSDTKDPNWGLAPKVSAVTDTKDPNWGLASQQAPSPAPEGLIQHIKNWDQSGKAADDIKNLAIGALKQPGRIVQAVTSPFGGGVAALTDKVYGLPAGASAQAMQPEGRAQKIGGYAADAAETVAALPAEAGPALGSRTLGYISNPTVAERGIATLGDAAKFTGDVVSLVKANLAVGPLTTTKVAGLITKYGTDAVKLAIKGSLGIGAYEAFKHLF